MCKQSLFKENQSNKLIKEATLKHNGNKKTIIVSGADMANVCGKSIGKKYSISF